AAAGVTAQHDACWAEARRAHGQAGGTRELVEVLLLHRHLPHADVVAGLAAAVGVGAATADVVAVEARKAAQTRATPVALACEQDVVVPPAVAADTAMGKVVILTARRPADPDVLYAALPTAP